jgi:hypothetical protein
MFNNSVLPEIEVEQLSIGSDPSVVLTTDPAITASYPIQLPASQGLNTQVLVNDGAGRLTWQTPGAASLPTTTKGDLVVYSTSNVRLPVGTDGQVLTAASAQPEGVQWTTAGGGSGDVVGPISAVDNGICVFDSTTGKLIKDSAITLKKPNVQSLLLGSSNSVMTGLGNIGIGLASIPNATTLSFTTAVGFRSLQNVLSGTGSVCIGDSTGSNPSKTSSSSEVLIGASSGQAMTNSIHCVLVGWGCGNSITSGFKNVCIGYQSDSQPTTQNAISIGSQSVSTLSHQCMIGNSALTQIVPNANASCSLGTTANAFTDLTLKGSTTGTVNIKPAAISGTQNYTLPPNAGNNLDVLQTDGTGVLSWVVAGSGETNTASNVGTGGVGVFKQKTGVDLEFKKINAASSKITIVDDVGNDEVDVDVVEANLTLDNLGGTLSTAKGGTGVVTHASGNFLTGAGAGNVLSTKVVPTGTVLGDTDAQTLTNKTITSTTNNVASKSLHSATTLVDVSASPAPTVGQVLTSVNGTTATWQTLPAAGTGDVVGPASATDNAFSQFDGITGKLLSDSVLTSNVANTKLVYNANTLWDNSISATSVHALGAIAPVGFTGASNSCLFPLSGDVLTSGANNVLVGRQSGQTLSTASFCVGLGNSALRLNSASNNSTAVGHQSLELTTGASNTAIGTLSGATLTTGSQVTCLGTSADVSVGTIVNSISLGALAVCDSNGQCTIGNTALTEIVPMPTASCSLGSLTRAFTDLTLKGSSTGTVNIKPAAISGTQNYTLPPDDGNNLDVLQTDGTGTLTWVVAGQTNTASNVGTAGVGVFKQKTGVDLEFKKINAASSKITIVDDLGNDEVDVDVVEANLTLDNLGGTLSVSKGGTGVVTHASGNFLTGAGAGNVLSTKVAPTGTVLGDTDAQTLTNKTLTSTTNNVAAKSLHSATTVVDVSASAAPTLGQLLTAVNGTTATWQTPAAAGDVNGPGSSTTNAVSLFSDTTGKLLKNSTLLVNTNDIQFNSSTLINKLTGATPSVFSLGAIPDGGLTGTKNYMSGELTGGSLTGTATENTAYGYSSLRDNVSSSFNTAMGSGALITCTGERNTAVGMIAGLSHTSGVQSCYFGQGARTSVGTANNQIAIGYGASCGAANRCQLGDLNMTDLRVGPNNIFTKKNATTVFCNGADILITLTGVQNHASGISALSSCTSTAQQNTAVGYQALNDLTTSSFSTGIGSNALANMTGASERNTAVGFTAGIAITGGDNCAFLGSQSDGTALDDYQTALGAQAKCTKANQVMLGQIGLIEVVPNAGASCSLGTTANAFKDLTLKGASSGTATIQTPAAAGTTTLTVPGATDTLVGRVSTDTLTNKTLTIPVLTSYTVAGLPAVGTAGGMIYVSDETGGATLAFSDGTNWRRVQDRAIVA